MSVLHYQLLMDQAKDSSVQSTYLSHQLENVSFPAMDIFETSDSYVLEVELPGGIDSRQVSLHYANGNLIIRGQLRGPSLPEGARYVQVERPAGQFHRVIHLQAAVEGHRITTRYELGILTVTIPKETRIEIQIEEHYAG